MNRRMSGWLLVSALCGLAACGGKPKEVVEAAGKPKPLIPIRVEVIAAQSRTIPRSTSLTGSLAPDETVTVSSEAAGRILSLKADFGQTVRKGEVIAELDKQEAAIAVERSRAALAQALARIGLDPDQQDAKPNSSPAVRQALAQLDDAKFKFDSAAKLVKSGDISQERFTELEKAYSARKAAAEATTDDLRVQIANVRALKADEKLAEKRLNDTTVRAPFDGAIQQRLVSAGQYLKENTPIYTLIKTYPLRLRIDVPESESGTVKVGTTLSFTSDAAPGKEFHAVVRELNPSLDTKSRSLTAEARLNDPDPRLRPGIFVQAQLVTDRGAAITVVPKAALYSVAGLQRIFVVRNGRAVACDVPPGPDLQGYIEVPGVQPGELVAVEKLGQLVDGLAVAVVNR